MANLSLGVAMFEWDCELIYPRMVDVVQSGYLACCYLSVRVTTDNNLKSLGIICGFVVL